MSAAVQIPSGATADVRPTSACGSGNGNGQTMSQRSTRGASKQRRDQINIEIQRLRDLLPLSDSIKDRLYQLQIMSLGCIYMRKHRYLAHVAHNLPTTSPTPKGIEICKALRGFMLMLTRTGKMLHVSENASEYLGHSVEEIMCQGDSIYDLVDHRDHAAVQAELASGPPQSGSFPEERVFICRLNLTRAAAKRQLQYHKFILLQGRYIHPAEYYQNLPPPSDPGTQQTQPMFAAYCQPLINPENAETMSSGNTSVFTSQHFLDMKFKEVDHMLAHHLGYTPEQLDGTSWYQLVHPSHVPELAYKHRLLCQEKEGSVLALLRLQTAAGSWLWLHTVFAVRGNFTQEIRDGRRVRHVIHCYYQILSGLEAATLQANSWIYSMRHTYPAAFPCNDSPTSEQDRPLSAASPFPTEPFQPCDFNSFVKQEVFTPVPVLPPPFPMNCHQIKVDIPVKQPVLSMFTPESSSPESSSSFNSSFLSQPFLERHPILEEIQSTKGTLPDLRDGLDDFFRQVEQPTSAHPCPQAQTPVPCAAAAPYSAAPAMRTSPQHATELYKYLGPALFANQAQFPREMFPHQVVQQRSYSIPDCTEYAQGFDPFYRKMSWAM